MVCASSTLNVARVLVILSSLWKSSVYELIFDELDAVAAEVGEEGGNMTAIRPPALGRGGISPHMVIRSDQIRSKIV